MENKNNTETYTDAQREIISKFIRRFDRSIRADDVIKLESLKAFLLKKPRPKREETVAYVDMLFSNSYARKRMVNMFKTHVKMRSLSYVIAAIDGYKKKLEVRAKVDEAYREYMEKAKQIRKDALF